MSTGENFKNIAKKIKPMREGKEILKCCMTQKLIICGATHTTQIVHTDQWEPEWCGTGPTHRRGN